MANPSSTRPPKPPPSEIGSVIPGHNPVSAGAWWASILDELEYVPELVWPRSLRTYDKMRKDGQIKGMNYALTLPVRQMDWRIDPNGMDPDKARALADNFGLKLVGDEDGPQKRSATKFNWDDFLREALLALSFGFNFFEQVVNVDRSKTPSLSYRKLAPRLPNTISEIKAASDGGLKEIVQTDNTSIPVTQLVAFVWEKEGGNWYGQSIWRGAYKYWALKETLLRINSITLDRNGMGIPWAEITDRDVDETVAAMALRAATSSRVAKRAGGVAPYGVTIKYKGVEGTLPDILSSIRYMDESMTRSTLTQFLSLGAGSKTGSYALGESFIDFFQAAINTVVQWFTRTFNDHVIEDYVEWNYGDAEEYAPKLVAQRVDSAETSLTDIISMVDKKLIVMDDELEQFLRKQAGLPQAGSNPRTGTVPDEIPPVIPEDDDEDAADTDDKPNTPASAGSVAARRSRDKAASAADEPASGLPREPKEHETAVDWAGIDKVWTESRDEMVSALTEARPGWIQQIQNQILEANGDLAALATMQVEIDDSIRELLVEQLQIVMGKGIESAVGEATQQGVTLQGALPTVAEITEQLQAQAEAILVVMAQDFASSAARNAIRLTGEATAAGDVSEEVAELLAALTEAYPREQMAGLASTAMNEARFRVHEVASGHEAIDFYHSSLLDSDSCVECVAGDETVYETIAEARVDFPTGKYKKCLGRDQCRCTVIARYHEDD